MFKNRNENYKLKNRFRLCPKRTLTTTFLGGAQIPQMFDLSKSNANPKICR
jgi:hypothetical protein